MYKHLRCQKTYRKRGYANQDRRGQIVDRVDIDNRPVIVDKRERLGDFEGDTVIGRGHKGVLVTLVDRATRETKIKALPNRAAENVTKACIGMLKNNIFFAKPYHSWERRTNDRGCPWGKIQMA